MSRLSLEILGAVVAFISSMGVSIFSFLWVLPAGVKSGDIESNAGFRRRAVFAGILPLVAGYAGGALLLTLFATTLFRDDRFYSMQQAVLLTWCPLVAAALLSLVDYLLPPALAPRQTLLPEVQQHIGPRRWFALLAALLVSAILSIICGVRFPILSVAGSEAMELGRAAGVSTLVYLVAATFILKLLDGLNGAASLVLLSVATAVLYNTTGTSEHFLRALSMILIGTLAGSIAFHTSRRRMPLYGSGTTLLGFLFAMLTVLARQKSLTAAVIVLPIFLLAVLLAGASFTFLERNLMLRREKE